MQNAPATLARHPARTAASRRRARTAALPLTRTPLAGALALAALAGCSAAPRAASPGPPAGGGPPWSRSRWRAATAAGSVPPDRQAGPHQRRVRRTLPASPPSRLALHGRHPPRARACSFAAASPPEHHDRAGVEFVVKVRAAAARTRSWSRAPRPRCETPQHRKWVAADVDLVAYAGRGASSSSRRAASSRARTTARRAFWGDAGAHGPGDRGAARHRLPRGHAARRPHARPTATRATRRPSWPRSPRTRVVFEQAIAQASWTKPSVASHPHVAAPRPPPRGAAARHARPGPRHAAPRCCRPRASRRAPPSPTRSSTRRGTNFEQGFDLFAGLHGAGDRPSKAGGGGRRRGRGARAGSTRGAASPRFLYVHTMDPHVPYAPPAAVRPQVRAAPRRRTPGRRPAQRLQGAARPRPPDRAVRRRRSRTATGSSAASSRELKARGLYDRALIVFIADHGEEFLDHGKWLHGKSVFDELIRVPLIVKFPGGRDAGHARQAAGAGGRRAADRARRRWACPCPPRPSSRAVPLQRRDRGRRAGAARGLGDQPPRLRRPRHAHRAATSTSSASAPRRTSCTSTSRRTRRRQTSRLEQSRERVRAAEGRRRGGHGARTRSATTCGSRAPGRYELQLRTGRLDRGRGADRASGPSERHEIEGNGRKRLDAQTRRPARPAAGGRLRRPADGRARVAARARATAGRCARRTSASPQEGVHPPAVPFKLPEIEPSPRTKRALRQRAGAAEVRHRGTPSGSRGLRRAPRDGQGNAGA